ncbi:hypothetical protein GKQ38_03750 [Candidatus Nanohaloarchaea archaeon]|nr:hypothetical protein GKQ38_03750 [Candidatus Nanohaloarchaea archaeon]
MIEQRSKEKDIREEKGSKTVREIFDQALENAQPDLKTEKLVTEVNEGLDDRSSQEEIFEACLEASKSYIGADPAMREVAADILLQKEDLREPGDFFELYVEECSHAGLE